MLSQERYQEALSCLADLSSGVLLLELLLPELLNHSSPSRSYSPVVPENATELLLDLIAQNSGDLDFLLRQRATPKGHGEEEAEHTP